VDIHRVDGMKNGFVKPFIDGNAVPVAHLGL